MRDGITACRERLVPTQAESEQAPDLRAARASRGEALDSMLVRAVRRTLHAHRATSLYVVVVAAATVIVELFGIE